MPHQLWLIPDDEYEYEPTGFPVFFSWKYHMEASTMSSFLNASPSQTQTSRPAHKGCHSHTLVTVHTDILTGLSTFGVLLFSSFPFFKISVIRSATLAQRIRSISPPPAVHDFPILCNAAKPVKLNSFRTKWRCSINRRAPVHLHAFAAAFRLLLQLI